MENIFDYIKFKYQYSPSPVIIIYKDVKVLNNIIKDVSIATLQSFENGEIDSNIVIPIDFENEPLSILNSLSFIGVVKEHTEIVRDIMISNFCVSKIIKEILEALDIEKIDSVRFDKKEANHKYSYANDMDITFQKIKNIYTSAVNNYYKFRNCNDCLTGEQAMEFMRFDETGNLFAVSKFCDVVLGGNSLHAVIMNCMEINKATQIKMNQYISARQGILRIGCSFQSRNCWTSAYNDADSPLLQNSDVDYILVPDEIPLQGTNKNLLIDSKELLK